MGSLSYIEGWHAIAEANRLFGFDGWTRTTDSLNSSLTTRAKPKRARLVCDLHLDRDHHG